MFTYQRFCDVHDSTLIKRVMYSHEHRKMGVEFKNGQKYEYDDISPEIFGAIVGSPSVGRAFHTYVRGNAKRFAKVS